MERTKYILKCKKHREIYYKMFNEIKSENEIYISQSLELIIENVENDTDNKELGYGVCGFF